MPAPPASAWYRIAQDDQLPTPSLLIYPQRVAENLQAMLRIAGGPQRLWPHIKTHKLAELVEMQLAAGISQFKCATIAEAELLARCQAERVLLAYPIVGANISRFLQLTCRFPGTGFATLVDDLSAARQLAQAAAAGGQQLDLWLDVDVGQHRTGVAVDRAASLFQELTAIPGLRVVGLHAYDGHIKDHDPVARTAHVNRCFAPVVQLAEQLARLTTHAAPPLPILAGGTPTFAAHAATSNRLLGPGTCLLWDYSYATKYPDLPFQYAAVLLTRVVSRPGPELLCLDLGYKAVASDNPDPRALLLDLPDATMVLHSEEHLVVRTTLADRYCVGDVLYAVPYHVCPTCALHAEVLVAHDGQCTARWPVVARDRRLEI